MSHIVLLGDSVFDNAAYVSGGPDVVRQLREDLGTAGKATLAAVDGAVMASVPAQLSRVPADATHLAISVGGNDALRASGILEQRVSSMAEALGHLAAIGAAFERDYGTMLDGALGRRLPTAICTIYNPQYPEPRRKLAVTALTVLNDAIIRIAVGRGVPVIDLRLVCNDPRDFANPIEPSVRGGEKIAATIATVVARHPFGESRTVIYG